MSWLFPYLRQVTHAHTDKALMQPFQVQLQDSDGEDTHVAGVKIHIAKDSRLKVWINNAVTTTVKVLL